MNFLLDTTTFSALMRRDARAVAKAAALTPTDRIVVCAITRGEILYGLERLPVGKRRNALEAEARFVFAQIPCLAVPAAAADHYASLKSEAQSQGTPLDENDLWIAAAGLAFQSVLVTTDSDFGRLSRLHLEDWTR